MPTLRVKFRFQAMICADGSKEYRPPTDEEVEIWHQQITDSLKRHGFTIENDPIETSRHIPDKRSYTIYFEEGTSITHIQGVAKTAQRVLNDQGVASVMPLIRIYDE